MASVNVANSVVKLGTNPSSLPADLQKLEVRFS